MDGDVDLLDDVDEQAAVDALRESVANVATLVCVQSRNLTKTIRINNDNECCVLCGLLALNKTCRQSSHLLCGSFSNRGTTNNTTLNIVSISGLG